MWRLNRRSILSGALVAVAVLTPVACRRHRLPAREAEDTSRPAMVLEMADPRTSIQLISGFHQLENSAWRWTGRTFSLSLRPPDDAPQHGAVLLMKLTIPQGQIDKLKTIAVTAEVNSAALPPETYSSAGDFLFQRDVPASAFSAGKLATVRFSLDKAAPPTPPDLRELGLVVTSVGFMKK